MEHIDTLLFWCNISLLTLLFCCVLVLLRYYFFFLRPFYKYPSSAHSKQEQGNEANKEKGISVIISGRNHYEEIKENLPFWLNQTHGNFEVLVVYDFSDDDLHNLLISLEFTHPQLTLIQFNQNINFFDEEKFSLSIGIKSAKHKYVLLTSAGCRPESEQCLSYLSSSIDDNTQVVAGCSIYPQRHSNPLSRFFYNEITVFHLAAILNKEPYSASHNMLLYHKDIFLKHHGYTSSYSLDSGPFDMFHSYLSNKTEAKVQLCPYARIKYSSPISLSKWITLENQNFNTFNWKKNRAKKEWSLYKAASALFHIITWLLMCSFIVFSGQLLDFLLYIPAQIFVFLYLLKTIPQFITLYNVHHKIGEKNIWWRAIWFEILYIALLPFLNKRKKRKKR